MLKGPIAVEEATVPESKRRFWRGKLVLDLNRVVSAVSMTPQMKDNSTESESALIETIIIDFRKESRAEQLSDHAWKLYEQGLMYVEIAETLGISQMFVTKVIRTAASRRGVELLNAHDRRAMLNRKRTPPPPYRAIQDEVIQMLGEGLLMCEVAARLHVSLNLLTRTVAAWHIQRGLPVADGRTRRKSLSIKRREISNDTFSSTRPIADTAGAE